ncbi:MAG: hypothetical protein QM776_10735 [Rhodocyclaceae bacterium]
MATLIWKAQMRYGSPGDEAAFFNWLQAIPGVVNVSGVGTELHIRFRSKRLSTPALRELFALYDRYDGDTTELVIFRSAANAAWFD